MNVTSFAKYSQAINAYLSSQYDSTYKTWNELVTVFFDFNIDPFVHAATGLANAFDNMSHPTYLRIQAKAIEAYFDTFTFSTATLRKDGFEEASEFINDECGLRITFETLRTLVHTRGSRDLIDMYNFVDRIYQLHVRYGTAITARSRRNTHWVIIERIKDFTEAMQPHIDFTTDRVIARGCVPKEKFLTMDHQPKVYSIIRGSYNDIVTRLETDKRAPRQTKNQKAKGELPKNAKCQYVEEPLTPIYESVLDCAETEIGYLLAYIDECYARPYRVNQLPGGAKKKDLASTKEHIRMCKSHILIAQGQRFYSASNIINDINEVRYRLQMGKKVVNSKTILNKYSAKALVRTNVNINQFIESDGMYLDTDRKIILSQHVPTDTVSTITRKHSKVDFKCTKKETKQEVFQFGTIEESKPTKRTPLRTNTRKQERKVIAPVSPGGVKRGSRDEPIDLTALDEPNYETDDAKSEGWQTEYAQSDPDGSVYGSEPDRMTVDDDYETPITPRSAKRRQFV